MLPILLKFDPTNAEHADFGSFASIMAIIVCVVFDVLIKKYKLLWMPESTASMLLGVVIGVLDTWVIHQASDIVAAVSDSFFFVLLPPIIFEAGYSLQRKRFFINMGSIMLFAVLGTLVSTLVIGYCLIGIVYLGWIPLSISYYDCLAFAALISATDPVATLSIFSSPSVDAPPRLHSLVFGESLLNDAIAIVLFESFVGLKTGKISGYGLEVGIFFLVFFGSMFIGIVAGLLLSFVTKRVNFVRLASSSHYEIILILLTSFASYFFTQTLNLSGIIALFFCGIVLAHYNRYNITEESHEASHLLAKTLSQICETAIFLVLGFVAGSTLSKPSSSSWSWSLISWLIFLCFLSRALHVFPFSFILNRYFDKNIPFRMQCVMWFAGLRGAIAFVLSTTIDSPAQQYLQSSTLIIVLVTSIGMGALTEPFMRLMRMRGVDLKEDNDTKLAELEEAAVAAVLGYTADIADHSRSMSMMSSIDVSRVSSVDVSGVALSTGSGDGAAGNQDSALPADESDLSRARDLVSGGVLKTQQQSALDAVNKTFEMWYRFEENFMKPWFGGKKTDSESELEDIHDGEPDKKKSTRFVNGGASHIDGASDLLLSKPRQQLIGHSYAGGSYLRQQTTSFDSSTLFISRSFMPEFSVVDQHFPSSSSARKTSTGRSTDLSFSASEHAPHADSLSNDAMRMSLGDDPKSHSIRILSIRCDGPHNKLALDTASYSSLNDGQS